MKALDKLNTVITIVHRDERPASCPLGFQCDSCQISLQNLSKDVSKGNNLNSDEIEFLNTVIKTHAITKDSIDWKYKSVCFTGVRDKLLEQKIIDAGGTISAGVTYATHILIAKNLNSSTVKMKRARQINITILEYSSIK